MAKIANKILEKCAIFHIIIFSDITTAYLSWFYDKGAIKDPAHTGISKGLSQVVNRGPIRKFLPKYANVYVTIQRHRLSAGAWTHYVTANGVRNGLPALPHPRAIMGTFTRTASEGHQDKRGERSPLRVGIG